MSGLIVVAESNRKKTVAYSSRVREFVNAFNHRWRIEVAAAGRKMVDSFSVSEKACPWLSLADRACGKTEEDSGKKDDEFFRGASRKKTDTSRASQCFLARGMLGRLQKLLGHLRAA
jgi:hypothetical protein